MRLLICTQAVDRTDPVLGFFHAWIAALAARADTVEIICLKEGNCDLPGNVRVYSLGKPSFAKASQGVGARLKYIFNFYKYLWRLRGHYDTVFVHMNEEYVLLAGIFWRIFGKRVILWRNHKMGSVLTWFACKLAHTVCYTSPSAYVVSYANATKMPIGIDTNKFKPGEPKPHSVLLLGRLDPVKKPELFLEAVERLEQENVSFHANVYGDPTTGNEEYAQKLKERFAGLKNTSFYPGVRNDETPAIYAMHDMYVNVTPSGSFDKTIGEAMAAGCVVVAANEAVRGAIPDELIVGDTSAEAAAKSIRHALSLSPQERAEVVVQARAYVEHEHSLALLTDRLFGVLTS